MRVFTIFHETNKNSHHSPREIIKSIETKNFECSFPSHTKSPYLFSIKFLLIITNYFLTTQKVICWRKKQISCCESHSSFGSAPMSHTGILPHFSITFRGNEKQEEIVAQTTSYWLHTHSASPGHFSKKLYQSLKCCISCFAKQDCLENFSNQSSKCVPFNSSIALGCKMNFRKVFWCKSSAKCHIIF